MIDLMKRWRGDSFLVDFGLREYHFGLFQALASHQLQLIAALDEVIKLVDIRIILFLDLADLPCNVPEPHLHPLHLIPSTLLQTNTPPLFLRVAQALLFVSLTDHPLKYFIINMKGSAKKKRGLLLTA